MAVGLGHHVPVVGPTYNKRMFLVTTSIKTNTVFDASLASVQAAAVYHKDEPVPLAQTERELLANALRTARGNKSAAAAALGIKAATFRDKLAKHGLG